MLIILCIDNCKADELESIKIPSNMVFIVFSQIHSIILFVHERVHPVLKQDWDLFITAIFMPSSLTQSFNENCTCSNDGNLCDKRYDKVLLDFGHCGRTNT